uniref:Uncharacterized protein n=1 Tax=Zea mays TaxID=4577 RepID=B6U9N2_MAIZE|nr:hypothetical protein [Zea mays]
MGKHVWAAALMALAVIVGLGVPPGRIAEARTLEKDDLLGGGGGFGAGEEVALEVGKVVVLVEVVASVVEVVQAKAVVLEEVPVEVD